MRVCHTAALALRETTLKKKMTVSCMMISAMITVVGSLFFFCVLDGVQAVL